MHRLKNFFLFAQIILVIVTLVAFASPVIHPGASSIPGLISLFFPFLLLLNVVFIVLWIFWKEYYALLSIAVLILGWNHTGEYIQAGGQGTDSGAERTFTIATFNAYQFNKIRRSKGSISSALDAAVTSMGNPDILCLQEAAGAWEVEGHAGYPHAWKIPQSYSMVFSKYPIIARGQMDFGDHSSLSGWLDIRIDQDTLRLYALHLSSNRITNDSEKLLEDGNIQDRSTWVAFGGLLRKYAQASEIRAEQALITSKHINSSPYPVVVCGDFNDVPLSYAYSKIRGDMKDSFVEAGSGIQTTYTGNIRGLRIDFILGSRQMDFVSQQTIDVDLSDHLPVVATLRF